MVFCCSGQLRQALDCFLQPSTRFNTPQFGQPNGIGWVGNDSIIPESVAADASDPVWMKLHF